MDKKDRDILVYAIRYALPRNTGALSDCMPVFRRNIQYFEMWELENLLTDTKYAMIDAFGDRPRQHEIFNIIIEEIENRR